MTRLQAKKVKEAMKLLDQAMVKETSITIGKRTNFMLSIKEETRLMNLVQGSDGEVEEYNYATSQLNQA